MRARTRARTRKIDRTASAFALLLNQEGKGGLNEIRERDVGRRSDC